LNFNRISLGVIYPCLLVTVNVQLAYVSWCNRCSNDRQ